MTAPEGALVVAYRACPACEGKGCLPCLGTGKPPPIPSLEVRLGTRPTPAPPPIDTTPPGVAEALERACRARLKQQRDTFHAQASNAKKAHEAVVAQLRAELEWLEQDRDALRALVKALLNQRTDNKKAGG